LATYWLPLRSCCKSSSGSNYFSTKCSSNILKKMYYSLHKHFVEQFLFIYRVSTLHYRNRCLCQKQDALGKGTIPLGGTFDERNLSAKGTRDTMWPVKIYLTRSKSHPLGEGVSRGQAGSRETNFSKKASAAPPAGC
jgi:hypothetical protein